MNNCFMRADDVAKELGISKSFAYKLIRQLNRELREKGFLTTTTERSSGNQGLGGGAYQQAMCKM